MPRKKRVSYGVQRKYKRVRYSDTSKCDILNDAFYESPELSQEDTVNDVLNEAFCIDPSSSIASEVTLKDSEIQVDIEKKTKETQVCVSVEDKDIQVDLQVDLDYNVPTRCEKIKRDLFDLPTPYVLNTCSDIVQILELYQNKGNTVVKLKVCVSEEGIVSVFVHNRLLPVSHPLMQTLPERCNKGDELIKFLNMVSHYSVCIGNPEEEFTSLVPIGAGISSNTDPTVVAYREGDFSAYSGSVSYSSTIRTVSCSLLTSGVGSRCSSCAIHRRALKQRIERKKKLMSSNIDFTKSHHKNSELPRELLIMKIEQQRVKINSLQSENEKLKRKIQKSISSEGIKLGSIQDMEMKDLMASCQVSVEKAFPDESCYQRLFWSQQLKQQEFGKHGMRWHPMIIKWCLYIRSKSQAAYDAIRDGGFIQLPSNRTLFDYSHYIKSELGFSADVLKMLHQEADKQKMFEENWRKYVGILFDEISVKEDLVYDKVTGELIGYCNLDDIGNHIMHLEDCIKGKEKSVAKCILVLMVKGVATSLQFPLAAFATSSITADFLYPIIWTAVSILEVHVKLRVLFLTCDGATSNRKFFNMHKLPGQNTVYFSVNPFDSSRNIFFISDVPHLLKTARNCFSNSYSHRNTRRLWRNGKDISWVHIVRLFEEHCEFNLYTPCPKLSRNHIDLNAFSYLKVNLAAQVLSSSVANALEDNYDESVSETVLFIRNMNKFFDILNVRSLHEGRNKRNPDLNPFTSVDDERLVWLKEDFLHYFESWAGSVTQRPGPFTKKERSTMLLSYQTLNGLTISVLSIVECVRFLLNSGAHFVLTSAFNQDPLEQHFGHYRHKGGSNKNPTVQEVRHILTNIRTVGAQALAPVRGNTQVNRVLPPIDHTKLPRRR